jgi:hypothetical protein
MEKKDLTDRDEHLAWAKSRALEILNGGDTVNAFLSIQSDLRKHSELADHPGLELGALQFVAGMLRTSESVRRWIEGLS